MTRNESPPNTRQSSGMTRNDSPVYLLYPPDLSGRRPSQWTQLQYVSPDQRAALQDPPVPERPSSVNHQPEQRPQHLGRNTSYGAYNRTMGDTRLYYENPSIRHTNSGPGNRTSPESSNRSNFCRQHPQPTRTPYWYCCRQCTYPGPHISSLYASCSNCGVPRCSQCPEELI